MSIEININCDLGEKSKHHSNKHDPDLLEIVNSANIACGYHAGDEETMNQVVEISKKNGVSIGAHPSFNDPENFGRERMNLSSSELEKLITDQYEILQTISSNHGENVTHIKPHGALNNMACEDIDLATTLAKVIKRINPDLIYLVPTGSKMEQAAKKLDMKIACEIFADRNYEDDGNLVSRKKPHALITDPEQAKKHVLKMVQTQSLNCHSGKQIPCEIDSVCIHGDNISSLETAKSIRKNLLDNGLKLETLNKMKKFICSLFVGGLLSFAPMFSVAQSQSAMEAYLCTLNDGTSMSDLMEVVEDWNDWSDEKGITSYSAWVLNPIFVSNADLNRQAL